MLVFERVAKQIETQEENDSQLQKELFQKARKKLKEKLVSRLGLSTVSSLITGSDIDRVRDELRVTCEAIVNEEKDELFSSVDYEEIIEQVINEVCGLGPIQPLLNDKDVTEIMINGCNNLFYEKNGELFESKTVFDSEEQILIVMDRILSPLGRRLDRVSPIVDARLENGDRVNAVASPVAVNGTSVTIRRFTGKITSLDRLVEMESLPKWLAKFLSWAVKCRQGIAVVGGTGSGKTTLLNALSCEISKSERIVTIEDSAELKFDSHPNVVRLEARPASIEGTGEITIRSLVRNALRMRPDRIVVGEVRGEECIDMLQAMNTGHDGSLTTLHAGTAQEAILRLVLMARFGMDLPAEIIEQQIATALDLIVMSQRFPDGKRYVTSISEISLSSAGLIEVQEIVSFDVQKRSWLFVKIPSFVNRAIQEGLLDKKEVTSWMSLLPQSREVLLE